MHTVNLQVAYFKASYLENITLELILKIKLKGSLTWAGEYAECVNISDYKYCMIAKPTPLQLGPSLVLLINKI